MIPETTTYIDKLVEVLERGWSRKKTGCVIIVAEGDDAGGAYKVAEIVKEKFDKYETKVAILGHIQRGGSPTCMDRVLATRLGFEAVTSLMNGRNRKYKIKIAICIDYIFLTRLHKSNHYKKETDRKKRIFEKLQLNYFTGNVTLKVPISYYFLSTLKL